ncbi:MAG: HD domain-containing protein [Clostridia bacterium]|nr:HD domain-containing protein [Clostridia bacterium]
MLKDYIREYVKEECSKSEAFRELYENHILIVAKYGVQLADLLGADAEAVELAAYLHDFSAVLDFEHINDHAIKGSKMADTLLRQFNYKEEKIQLVKQAIAHHSKPLKLNEGSLEAVCLSNADAMSQIAKPYFWLYFNFAVKKRSYEDGIKEYRQWMEANWQAMIDEARQIVEKDYEGVKQIKK